MKTTKRIICIFLAFASVLLMLVGCKDNSLPVDRVVAETDTHRVFYSNEKCYIEFFEDLKYSGKSDLLSIKKLPRSRFKTPMNYVKKLQKTILLLKKNR